MAHEGWSEGARDKIERFRDGSKSRKLSFCIF